MSVQPTLLMLPGFDGTGLLFDRLSDALDDSFDCLPLRYAAHASLSGYATQIREACPTDVPVIVVAESFSGPLALNLLADAPNNVVGGVLSTTFAKPPLALMISLAEKLRLASFTIPAVSEQILRLFCLNGVRDIPTIRRIAEVVRSVDGRAVQSRFAAMTSMDATATLPNIRVPLRLLVASNDRVVRPRYWKPIAAHTAQVDVVDVDGPHLLLQTRVDECARAIGEFAQSVGSVSTAGG